MRRLCPRMRVLLSARSLRLVAVVLFRVAHMRLVGEQLQRVHDGFACLFRVDHGVDGTELEREICIDRAFLVFVDILGAQRIHILPGGFRLVQIMAVDDVHRTGRAQHRDL